MLQQSVVGANYLPDNHKVGQMLGQEKITAADQDYQESAGDDQEECNSYDATPARKAGKLLLCEQQKEKQDNDRVLARQGFLIRIPFVATSSSCHVQRRRRRHAYCRCKLMQHSMKHLRPHLVLEDSERKSILWLYSKKCRP